MYQKEIIYMGLFHNDVKERNAGYLKVDKREGAYRLELQVKNIPGAITGSFPIRLQSETGWQETGVLTVKEGNGKWNGSIAEPVRRAEVLLSDVKKIKGESRLAEAGESKEEAPDGTARSGKQREELPDGKAQPEAEREESPDSGLQPEAGREERPVERPRPETVREEPLAGKQRTEEKMESEEHLRTMSEPVMRAESMRDGGQQGSGPARPGVKAGRILVKPEHTPLYENKWEQLLTTYEQIHPYGDNRVYVKLAPKDFIILRENYQHLVNNSFLLHGFYNYRYLILGKENDFYLGVPGVFYEREKMVALMFGFEAFECEGGRAEEGKFGYYLRKVEL